MRSRYYSKQKYKTSFFLAKVDDPGTTTTTTTARKMADYPPPRDMREAFKNMDKVIGEEWEVTMIKDSRDISGIPAPALLRQMGLDVARTEPVSLLDSACGVGVVAYEAHQILSRDVLEEGAIVCTDISSMLVQLVERRTSRERWVNTTAVVCDATVSRKRFWFRSGVM